MKNYINAIKISFYYSAYTSLSILFTYLIGALLPAFETIVLALVIKDIWTIQEGKIKIYNFILLVVLVILTWIMEQLKEFFVTKHMFSLGEKLRLMLLNKVGQLKYSDIENKDINDQFTRVISNCEIEITQTYLLIMNTISVLIRIASLVLIVAKYSILCSMGLVLLNIPLLFLAKKNGESVYEMDKEVSFLQREIDYYNDVLVGRECYLERNIFDFSKWVQMKWEKSFDQMMQKYLQGFYSYFWKVNGYSIISGIITIAMIGMLALTILNNFNSVGIFIAISTNLLTLLGTITSEFTQIIREMARKNEYLEDLNSFIEINSSEEFLSKPVFPYIQVERIEFQKVSFKYPDTDRYVLKNFSYVFQGKRRYAIVGENGQGKTTIVKLMMGLYDDYEGNIYVNGKELRAYSVAERRSFFSVLHQDYAKYNLSLFDNIMIGNFYSQRDDFEKVVKKIELNGIIQKYKNGEKTRVGKVDNDNELSGGEWQKIALARALIKETSVYVLDEPVSAFDPLVEAQFYKDFDELVKNKLAIVITHRLGAIKFVDNIVVLSNGRVAESGSYDELMQKKGIFQEMYEIQRGYYK